MSKLREYWDIVKADVYIGKRKEQSLKLICVAAVALTVISTIMTVINIMQHFWLMAATTGTTAVVFLITWALCRFTKNRNVSVYLDVLSLAIIFSYYVISGNNEGFAILWVLLVPMLIMSIYGLKVGLMIGTYFQVLLVVLFWTPLRGHMGIHYSGILMNRFPILYFSDFIVSAVSAFSLKKSLIIQDNYQQRLEKAVKDEHDKVIKISMQTITAISETVDAKDAYTREHSMRVARYSCMIARQLGCSEQEIEELYNIALLHDIGKIGIHDAVLNKSSRLTADEYAQMKQHTTIGGKILKTLTFLEHGDEGAMYHHEKYDGTGYPSGICGDEIPLVGRIIAVADAYDAMNSNRVYRSTQSQEYIQSELLAGRGSQFDPVVVDAFLQCLAEEKM